MEVGDSLVLLHAIFRHGERTPEVDHMYPKHTHLNEKFYPYGSGQLTRAGKKTMYELGRMLRKRYDNYLGSLYIPERVDAWVSDLDRTKMSLQMVLASLFPPKEDQILEENLNWQPIPFSYIPYKQDRFFVGPVQDDFIKAYMENIKKTNLEKYNDFFAYFKEHTGFENPVPRDVWLTLGTISTEREWGFESEPWVADVYDRIIEVGILEYHLQTATKELKRIVAGELFVKILQDTRAKVAGESRRDLHLYSGHEYNVAHVLTILGLMYPHFPRYAACVLLEVHKLESGHCFKVVYKNCITSEFKLMTFPDGSTLLPLEKLEKIVSEFVSLDNTSKY